ncbi:MAG: sugar transferase [Clostridia bacterium]|nr:sugar transferase [Clostridia bacterium]
MRTLIKKLCNSSMIYYIHVVMDLLLVFLSTLASSYILSKFIGINSDISSAFVYAWLVCATVYFLFKLYGVFQVGRNSYADLVFSTVLSLFLSNMGLFILTQFLKIKNMSIQFMLVSFSLQCLTLFVWKLFVAKLFSRVFQKKEVMFIGGKNNAKLYADKLLAKDRQRFILKYVDGFVDNDTFQKIQHVDMVFLGPDVEEFLKRPIIAKAVDLKKTVYLVPELTDITVLNSNIGNFGDIPAIRIDHFELPLEKWFFKRIFDIVVSLAILILSSPFLLAGLVATKLFDGGDPIFRQERITKNGKAFKLFKIRTMVTDAEKHTGPVLAKANDSRITPLGAFLRAVRIDEIPQIINVLKGDMSIVGPRPERPFFVDCFIRENPDYAMRHAVKTGITGLAQVSGKYTTSAEDKLRYDLYYIRNYSFLMDVEIILKTIKILFIRDSSMGVSTTKALNHGDVLLDSAKKENEVYL